MNLFDYQFSKTQNIMENNNLEANVTLIRPPILQMINNLSTYGPVLPIGLAYIAAVIRDAGHSVDVIDSPGEAIYQYNEIESPVGKLHIFGLTVDQIIDRVDPETEIIGITHMFLHEWPIIKDISERIKAKYPEMIIIIGGENATAFHQQIFHDTDAVDYCILGEGENTVVNLIHCIKAGLSTNINGVISRIQSPELKPALSNRIRNIDTIPRPAWEYFQVENYFSVADHHGVHRGRTMPILASRGCPYKCSFCSNPQMWTQKYNTRDPKEVADEMKHYVEKYKIDNFNFCDLTAIVVREWIIEFCQILKKENLPITWQLPTGTRSEILDEEVLKLLYDTGCRNITYAPESGSDRMLKIIIKKVNLSKMLRSIRTACRQEIVTRVSIIIGHPKEKRSDIWKSLWFLIKCAFIGCNDAAVFIFSPYPGNADTNQLIKEGKVAVDNNYYYIAMTRTGGSTKTYNSVMGTSELIFMQFFMMSVFFTISYLTHPWRVIRVISSVFTGKEKTHMDAVIRTQVSKRFRPKHPKKSTPQPVEEAVELAHKS